MIEQDAVIEALFEREFGRALTPLEAEAILRDWLWCYAGQDGGLCGRALGLND